MADSREGQIEELVKAGWRAVGLSQKDLAEVLTAALKRFEDDGSARIPFPRFTRIAEALELPRDFNSQAAEGGRSGLAPQAVASLQSVLDLRLLHAFRELRDQRSKRMLIHLVERLLKGQASRRRDG